MYLKALEIQGFKSFPTKTYLAFEKQITAIVGPNGSGKSNISDALRWVMGEQNTRTLRGGKMEDVIFGGTEVRNQVGFAEVSLILDNSARMFHIDQDEVAITRRYYRSGESEYAINRETVRLKDVHEILMDTGMGRDGYAIIDQGRVGEILSQRSIDRREILEEAAGISRFRHRKEESERKLGKTEDDLTRINDKIDELSLQVGPLEDQARVAKQYLILRDELRILETSLWLSQLDTLREDAIKLKTDASTAQEAFQKGQEALDDVYHNAEQFAEHFRAKDLEADKIRQKIADIAEQTATMKSEVAVLLTTQKADADTITRLTAELSEHAMRGDTLQSQIDERNKRIDTISDEMAAVSNETEALLHQMSDVTQSQGVGEGTLHDLMQKEGEESIALAAEGERILATTAAVKALQDRRIDCEADLAAAQVKLDEVTTAYRACKRSLEAAEAERQTLQNMIRGHELKMSSREDSVSKLREEVSRLTIDYGAIENRIGLLSEMEREYQGFHRAVKEVMQASGRGRVGGVHGPVANLLSTDSRYALAIETALGGASQNIIVNTPEDAKNAINFLKRNEAGRATFLPLSSIRGNTLTERGLETRPGFVGRAIDIVQFDTKFTSVYNNILGRTVIVETLDHAISIAKAYDNKFRIVTLDGQEIRAGGSLTGGSVAKTVGFLSRANEITALKKKQSDMQARLSTQQAELDKQSRELKSATATLDTSRIELRQVEDSVLTLEGTRNTQEMLRQSVQKSCADLEQELLDIAAKTTSSEAEITSLQESIQSHETALSAYRKQAETLTEGQKDLIEARESLSEQLSALNAKRASLAAEREADRTTAAELQMLANSLGGDKRLKETQIQALKIQENVIITQVTEKETQLVALDTKATTLRENLVRIGEEKMAIEAKRTTVDRDMQERNREILALERECARLEQRKQATDMEEKQIIDKLWDTYELSHSAAMEIRKKTESIPLASKEVTRIKGEITGLGTPNIGAIEQFEIIGKRYNHFTEQRDDIEKAKDELTEIINDITKEMEEIFTREFGQINKSFTETFVELFGGGDACLELEDPENILGSGIEIRVQPPGKSLKTLTLLSGGEKAFVAIALYFAIQKIRPTPFCVMDEIEAALDEANVQRFAEYMRKLAHRTQFIAITHRRGTMEEADTLFGVTMQERGVSRVIHVDLEEAERTMGVEK